MAKHAPPEARRAQILNAAITWFAEKGYHETSIDDIAALTGLSKGAIYHHFQSKREIFLALLDAWSADLLARWQRIGRQADPLQALSHDTRETLAWAEDIVPLSRASLEFCCHAARDEESRRRVAAVYAAARRHFARLIEDARRQGLLGEVNPHLMATALIAMFEGLFMLKAVDPQAIDVGASWREGVAALFRGLSRPVAAGEGGR